MRPDISPRITEKKAFYQITKKGSHLLNGFEKLLFHAGMIMRRNTLKKTVYGMEPAADYHKPLGEYLISRGVQEVSSQLAPTTDSDTAYVLSSLEH